MALIMLYAASTKFLRIEIAVAERVDKGIYKVGRGVYDVHVSTGRQPDGRYGKLTRRVKGTLTEARNERAKMTTGVDDGSLVPSTPTTMAELHARYVATKATAAPATQRLYEYSWGLVAPYIGDTRVTKLRAIDLDHAYAEVSKQVSANTTRKAHKHVSALLARAVAWELVGRNVAQSATPPAETPFNVHPPTFEEVVALVGAAGAQEPSFGALVHLAATTGARRGELVGLRWGDLDFDRGTLRIVHQADADGTLRPTKSRHARTIPLDDDTIAVLKRLREQCDEIAEQCDATITDECFVFSPEPGNRLPFRVDGITQRFDRLRKTTGATCRFHDLRHAQATRLLAAGLNPVAVAERLGQTVEVLMSTYGHSDSEQAMRAAGIGALRVSAKDF